MSARLLFFYCGVSRAPDSARINERWLLGLEERLADSVQPDAAPLARVLLVEDYPNLARLLTLALECQGYHVCVAGDSRGALDLARQREFDIVISDLRLPDGSGHDLMRALIDLGLRRGIALSGCGESEDLRESHAAGFAEHLLKPLDADDLHAAIQRVLADSSAQPAVGEPPIQ